MTLKNELIFKWLILLINSLTMLIIFFWGVNRYNSFENAKSCLKTNGTKLNSCYLEPLNIHYPNDMDKNERFIEIKRLDQAIYKSIGSVIAMELTSILVIASVCK